MGYEEDDSLLLNCFGEEQLISADVCVEVNDEGFEELPESISKHSCQSNIENTTNSNLIFSIYPRH